MRIKFTTRSTRMLAYRIAVLSLILISAAQFCAERSLLGQTAAYLVTDLTNDDTTQVPSKLNNLGVIVGRKAGDGKGAQRAAVWSNSHSKGKHLGTFVGGDYSSATGINDAGEITGASNTATAILPFLWTEKGGLQRLPVLPGDVCGQAVAINKHGDIAAYSSGPNGTRALLWSRKGSVRDLGVLPGGKYSRANDLNDSDEVAGVSGSNEGDRAVLWTKDGNARDLGTLPGDSATEAVAVNNAGDVVGYSRGPVGMRAFLWTKSGGMEELGFLTGGSSSRALAINDSGTIVGASATTSGDHAFVWTRETGMLDLNNAASTASSVVLVEAHAINARGQILAMGESAHQAHMGTDPSEDYPCAPSPPSAFLLTPASVK
jgi:probable HAF family extracellular repeat protein